MIEFIELIELIELIEFIKLIGLIGLIELIELIEFAEFKGLPARRRQSGIRVSQPQFRFDLIPEPQTSFLSNKR